MVVGLALTLTICGCAVLYLASPNQKWLAQAPPRRPLVAAGSLLLASGLAAWIAALRPLSGLFVTLHVAMVCLFAFPYVATLRGVWPRN
jgi:hypothetical protein